MKASEKKTVRGTVFRERAEEREPMQHAAKGEMKVIENADIRHPLHEKREYQRYSLFLPLKCSLYNGKDKILLLSFGIGAEGRFLLILKS